MPRRSLATLLALALLVAGCAANPRLEPSAGSLALDPELTREAAIEILIADSFLPKEDARCVIDKLHAEVGTYNPKSDLAAEIDTTVLVADCTFVEGQVERDLAATDSTVDRDDIQELEVTTGEIAAPFELSDETQPTFTPGNVATGSIVLDGKKIEVVTITPLGFKQGDVAPVLLAFPPGGQNLQITQDVASFVYANQAIRRGWVVVSPAAPGSLWSGEAAKYVPEMVRWIRAWVTVDGGRPHIGGMSNGGISAFNIATQNPGMFRSLVAYPGFPDTKESQQALSNVADIPVRMWVGGADSDGWVSSMEVTAENLRTYGGDVELYVLPGEPHVLLSTQDGQLIFDQLESAR